MDLENLKKQAEEGLETAKDKAEDLKDKVGEAVEAAKDKAEDVVSDIKDKLGK
ncbi:hypothetical protein [uncultured Actinomyces sp.]|uniref:hypothetical protein n=1 Tax=uncultured Actinomyces sp. TaxID=249061 RepID=UPI0028E29897|nr:hypothetical protein [uncultured Actinomyces sp.]